VKRSRFPFLISLFVLVFFYAPILLLAIQSFNDSRYPGSWKGFTFKWYAQLLEESNLWAAVQNTLIVALVSTVVATVLGTLAAWVLHRYRSRLQEGHHLLVYLPLVVPDLLMGISLLLFFVNIGIQLGLTTVILAHITFCTSYVALVLLSRLQDFDYSVIEAAQDLGAGWWTILWKVLIPILGPGLLAGALLAFTLSVDDFVITFFVNGPGSNTLPIYIYSMMKRGAPTMINALSVVMMLITFLVVVLSQHFVEKSQTKE